MRAKIVMVCAVAVLMMVSSVTNASGRPQSEFSVAFVMEPYDRLDSDQNLADQVKLMATVTGKSFAIDLVNGAVTMRAENLQIVLEGETNGPGFEIDSAKAITILPNGHYNTIVVHERTSQSYIYETVYTRNVETFQKSWRVIVPRKLVQGQPTP